MKPQYLLWPCLIVGWILVTLAQAAADNASLDLTAQAWRGDVQKSDDPNRIKTGSISLKWDAGHTPYATLRLDFDPPRDCSSYESLHFWAYAEKNADALITLTATSPGANGNGDYFYKKFKVDFDGWREFTFPLSSFAKMRQPAGWNAITCVQLLGHIGAPPTSGTVLYISDIGLRSNAASTPSTAPTTQASTSPQDLIVNGRFEQPLAVGKWDENNWAHNEVEFARDPVNPHSGQVSERMTMKHAVGVPNVQLVYRNLAVQPNMGLQVRFWLRGTGTNIRPIVVQFQKGGAPFTSYFRTELAATADWQETVLNLTLPANIDPNDTCLIFTLGEENTIWIDDVSVLVLPQQQPGEPLVGNQVANGSFALGVDRWYATFRESGGLGTVLAAEENNVAAKLVAVETSDAPQGRRALSFEIYPQCRMYLTSAYFPLRYGHPASVGFWMKAEKRGKRVNVGLGQGRFPSVLWQRQTFTADSDQWKFYSFQAMPTPAPRGTYFLEFNVADAGKYLLDGVTACEGETPLNVSVATRTEMAFEPLPDGPVANIFNQLDDVAFRANVTAPPGQASQALAWRVVDVWDQEIGRGVTAITLDGKGFGQATVKLPGTRFGSFKCEAFAADKAPADPAAMPLAEVIYHVLPKLKSPAESPDSFFGGHVNLSPYNLLIAQRAGFRWLRLHPPLITKWIIEETQKGHLVFDTAGVARAKQLGFTLLGNFDTTPAFYADAPPADAARSAWYASYPPADMDAWSNYVTQTAKAFGPYISHWELWNEPDGGFLRVRSGQDKAQVYLHLAQVTRPVLDAAEPGAQLIGPTLEGPGRPFGPEVLSQGAAKVFDAISFHFYGDNLDPAEQRPSLAAQLDGLQKAAIQGCGKPLPLWDTEGGIWLNQGNTWLKTTGVPATAATTVFDAAHTLVRTAVTLKAMGIARHFMYAAFATPSGRMIYRDECSGFIDVNGIPHAALGAHAAMVSLLDDAAPIGFSQVDVGPAKVSLAQFKKGNGTISAVWSRLPVKLAAIPGIDVAHVTAFDMMANPLEINAGTTAGISPVYLLGK